MKINAIIYIIYDNFMMCQATVGNGQIQWLEVYIYIMTSSENCNSPKMRRLPAPAVVNPEVGGPSSALPPHRQVLSSILHVKLRYISFKWQQHLRKSLSQVCTVGGYQKTSNHCGWVLTTASQPGLVKLCRQHPVSLSRSASYRLDISGNRGSFSGPYVSPREDR